MKLTNADKILFRSSSTGYLMTDPRSKTQELSETCIGHLVDVFALKKYGRREFVSSKFLEKGNEREEHSIGLLSFLTQITYEKNTTRLYNEFIEGEPDLFNGTTIQTAKRILDIKSSWSLNTFLATKEKAVDKGYYWQGQSYMWLTGADYHSVVFCLVNGTQKVIMDEKRIAGYQMGIIDPESRNEAYKERCKQIEINHIFDLASFQEENPGYDFDNDVDSWEYDIPYEDRMFQFHFERNNGDIERLKERIVKCRKFMNKNLFKVKEKDYKQLVEKGKQLRKKLSA